MRVFIERVHILIHAKKKGWIKDAIEKVKLYSPNDEIKKLKKILNWFLISGKVAWLFKELDRERKSIHL